MTEFIILNEIDMLLLLKNKPVVVRIDNKPYVIVTDEYFESQSQNEYLTTQEAESEENE
jgi:hypothetical protein